MSTLKDQLNSKPVQNPTVSNQLQQGFQPEPPEVDPRIEDSKGYQDVSKNVLDYPRIIETMRRHNKEEIEKSPEIKEGLSTLQEFKTRLSTLQKEKRDEKTKNRWMQIAEKVGHALVQYGAGAYGMKHGVDMSGLKFDKTDWHKRLVQDLKLIDDEINLLETGKVSARKQIESARDRIRDAGKLRADYEVDALKMAQKDKLARDKLTAAAKKEDPTDEVLKKGQVKAEEDAMKVFHEQKKDIRKKSPMVHGLKQINEDITSGKATVGGMSSLFNENMRMFLTQLPGGDKLIPEIGRGAEADARIKEFLQQNTGAVLDSQFSRQEFILVLEKMFQFKTDPERYQEQLQKLIHMHEVDKLVHNEKDKWRRTNKRMQDFPDVDREKLLTKVAKESKLSKLKDKKERDKKSNTEFDTELKKGVDEAAAQQWLKTWKQEKGK